MDFCCSCRQFMGSKSIEKGNRCDYLCGSVNTRVLIPRILEYQLCEDKRALVFEYPFREYEILLKTSRCLSATQRGFSSCSLRRD